MAPFGSWITHSSPGSLLCTVNIRFDEPHPRKVQMIFPPHIVRRHQNDVAEVDETVAEASRPASADRDSAISAAKQSDATELYDAALESFVTLGRLAPASKAALTKGLAIAPAVAAYLVGDKVIGDRSSFVLPTKEPNIIGAGYCALSMNKWRRAHGAISWVRQTVNETLLPAAMTKCALPCCFIAGQPSAFKKCSACKRVWYHSTVCQKAHWPTHKFDCAKWKAEDSVRGSTI